MWKLILSEDPKQAIRLRRFLFAATSYIIFGIVLGWLQSSGFIGMSGPVLIAYFSGSIFTNAIFYLLIRSGYNRRFKNRGLTSAQMLTAILWTTILVYFTDQSRNIVQPIYYVIFLFGIFDLEMRRLLLLSFVAIFCYGCALLLARVYRPGHADFQMEFLHWTIMVVVLPWFSIISSHISKIRNQLLLDSYKRLQNARSVTIMGLAKLAEYRDQNTGEHLERIREYARIIAAALSKKDKYRRYITSAYIEDIYQSAVLHDIGKVGIPDAILLKPSKLSPREFEIIKQHSVLGGDALKSAEEQMEDTSFLNLGKEISYYHHERWNGAGYPMGLKGAQIPLSARIVAIADVYDALTSDRVYKEAYSHTKAKEILISERGHHFDPDIVDVFLENEDEFDRIRRTLRRPKNVRLQAPLPDEMIRLEDLN